jgi:hypothetical protein
MQQEIWRPSLRFPEVLVSSHGRVLRPKDTEPKLGQIDPNRPGGQPRRRIWYKGQKHYVHQLVCEVFQEAKPFPEAVVIHLDEFAGNNVYNNMKWGTDQENRDRYWAHRRAIEASANAGTGLQIAA